MARRRGREAVYEVADQFRQRCLAEGKSLLWPLQTSWTAANLSALWKAFIEHPDESKRSFLEKWHDQLLDEPEDVHRVAADLMVFYSLFPAQVQVGKQVKLRDIRTIIGWKLAAHQPNLDAVERAFEEGLGHAGINYLTGRPWQIAYYLEFSRLAIAEKIDLKNPESCKQLADRVRKQVQQSAGARHILLHLLFPDQFERIASEEHKRRIVEAFREEAGTSSDLDDALLNVRQALAKKYGREDIDFYDEQIEPRWHNDQGTDVHWWVEKTHVRGRTDRMEGDYAVGKALWSPQRGKGGADIYRFMRDVKPGDIILHLTDDEAFTRISRAAASVEEFGGLPGTEWGEQPSYLVRLQDSIVLEPPLARKILFEAPYKERLQAIIERGQKNLFFNRELNLNQGAYLTPLPPQLVSVLNGAYKDTSVRTFHDLIGDPGEPPAVDGSQRAWIFQANPSYYDIRSAVRHLPEQTWLVAQHRDRITVGDRAYMWESGPEGGIVATGEVVDGPALGLFSADENRFMRKTEKVAREQLRVKLRIQKVLDPLLSRRVISSQPKLKKLSIFKMAQGTNFEVTPEEARVLEGLIGDGEAPKLTSWDKAVGISDVQRITARLTEEGFLFSEVLVKNYLLSIRTKPFVLLTGTSGGGKTALTRLVAQALGEPYIVVAVKPNWTDSRDLLGFYNPISRRYVRTQTLSFIFDADAEYKRDRRTARRYHLCLDEMNLSRVEYYFAELLSALERPDREVHLHSEEEPDVPRSLSIPPNLVVVGTVNIDETVQPFSDKVKDRANTIAIPIDLDKYSESLKNWNQPVGNAVKQRAVQFAKTEKGRQAIDLLLRIQATLLVQRVQFGYRTVDEILAYLAENDKTDLLPFTDALDLQVMQKVLPKVSGRGSAFEKLLACLEEKCGACLKCDFTANGLIHSAERVERMAAILRETGYTSYDAAS